MTSSTLIACLQARLQRQSHSEVLGLRAPIEECWGHKPVRSTAVTVSQHHSVTMSRCHSCPWSTTCHLLDGSPEVPGFCFLLCCVPSSWTV